jgi:hypothetical protein
MSGRMTAFNPEPMKIQPGLALHVQDPLSVLFWESFLFRQPSSFVPFMSICCTMTVTSGTTRAAEIGKTR